MIKLLQHWDEQLLLALNGWGGEGWDAFWLYATGTYTWSWLYATVLLSLFWHLRWRGLIALVFIALTVALCDQVSVHLFKSVFTRLRPCHNPELESVLRLVGDRCGGQYGFVSSHAANSVGVAVLMQYLSHRAQGWFARLVPVMALWAFLTSYSRIYLGVHYPFDVIAGAILGGGIGIMMGLFYTRIDSWVQKISA